MKQEESGGQVKTTSVQFKKSQVINTQQISHPGVCSASVISLVHVQGYTILITWSAVYPHQQPRATLFLQSLH